MLNFKRFGKMLVCLLLCVACVVDVTPVSALTSITVRPNTVGTPEKPDLKPGVTDAVEKGRLTSYVRMGPYAGSTLIGCMEEGTKLTVLGSKNQYYKIDCYDMVGYIAKSQVAQDEAGNYYVRAQAGSSETKYLPAYSAQKTLELKNKLVEVSKKYIGTPYVTGGTGRWGFDCSGYTMTVFADAGIDISRSLYVQLADSIIVAREDMQPGDLVIFSNTDGPYFASHIGMYLGNGMMIHCGTTKGVTIVDLNAKYYDSHFQCARRVVLSDVSIAATMPSIGSITGSIGSGWRN